MTLKSEKVVFRLPQQDKRFLRKIADLKGETMAVVLRELIRRQACELGLSASDLQRGGNEKIAPAGS